MTTPASAKPTIDASQIRARTFPRRGAQAAREFTAFLNEVADHVERLQQQHDQLEDQLALAEADRQAAAGLREQLAASEAANQVLTDRVELAEATRDAATRTCEELEAELEELANREPILPATPALEAAADCAVDTDQIIRDAAEAAARTRSDAHAQARQILEEAQRASDAVRSEQQRWAGEAERALRTRLDHLAAEADARFVDAREAAARILTSAGEEAERIIAHASTEADRMLSEARAMVSSWSNAELDRDTVEWPDTDGPVSVGADGAAPNAAAPKTGAVSMAGLGEGAFLETGEPVDAFTLLAKADQLLRAAGTLPLDDLQPWVLEQLLERIETFVGPDEDDLDDALDDEDDDEDDDQVSDVD